MPWSCPASHHQPPVKGDRGPSWRALSPRPDIPVIDRGRLRPNFAPSSSTFSTASIFKDHQTWKIKERMTSWAREDRGSRTLAEESGVGSTGSLWKQKGTLTENAPKTLRKGQLCNLWLSLVRISCVAITTTTTETRVLLLGWRCIHAHWQGTLSSPRTLADGALSPRVFSWVSGCGSTPTGNTVL